jgi:hypothetical protein
LPPSATKTRAAGALSEVGHGVAGRPISSGRTVRFGFEPVIAFLLLPRVSDHDLEAAGDVEIDIDRF